MAESGLKRHFAKMLNNFLFHVFKSHYLRTKKFKTLLGLADFILSFFQDVAELVSAPVLGIGVCKFKSYHLVKKF